VTDLKYAKNNKLNMVILQAYLLLMILGGIFTMRSILRIPGETSSAIVFGLSGARLILLSGVLSINLIAAWVLVKSLTNQEWFTHLTQKFVKWIRNQKILGSLLIICILGIISCCNAILQIPELREPVTLAYYVRLQPVLLWAAILCGQTFLALHFILYNFILDRLKQKGRIIYTIALTFGIIVILWIWINQTGYGISTIDEGVGWHAIGTPLLEAQVFLAWGISLGFFLGWIWLLDKPFHPSWGRMFQKDILICAILWVATFSIWMSKPLKPNWFLSEPRPPNYEFYPNSDASVYDVTAQNLLLGEGFKTRGAPFTLRPLYAAFLAGLHTIGGPAYEAIIWMQVAVLALIPILLYALGKIIHNRVSGLLVALLFIFRESNAIVLGDSISEAHPKLLLPFLPATLGALLFIYVISKWLQDPVKHQNLPIVSGGILGLFMLVRPEFGIFFPFIGLAALLQLRKHPQIWLRGMVLLTTGLVVALSPWIWRNYQLTGTIYIDSPHYRLDFISKRYQTNPIGFVDPTVSPEPIQGNEPVHATIVPELEPLTNLAEPSTTIIPEVIPQIDNSIQHQTEEMAENVIGFIQENPNDTRNFILNHFMNNMVQTILYLPSSYPITTSAIKYLGHHSIDQFWLDCCSLTDYERRYPFWPKWDGILPWHSWVPLTINLFLVAIGIGITWHKNQFIGVIPLFVGFGFYLINALVRNSGGRYTIPVNWISIYYFGIGLIQIMIWGLSFFRKKPLPTLEAVDKPTGIKKDCCPIFTLGNLGIALGFFTFGCILPVLERTIPHKYGSNTLETRLDTLLQPETTILNDEEMIILGNFFGNNGSTLTGLALYPRYHKSYQMGSVWNYYQDRPYTHIDFYLSSPSDTGVVLPLDGPPDYFPNAIDALVFGCPQTDYIDALAVVLFSKDEIPIKVLWRYPFPEELVCPLASPP
jgi:hypothetical protein